MHNAQEPIIILLLLKTNLNNSNRSKYLDSYILLTNERGNLIMPERKEKWEKRLEKVKKKNKKDLDEKLKRSYDLFDLEDTEEMKIIHELK
jgi:hypothetical protein